MSLAPHSAFQAESFLTDVLGGQNVIARGDQLIHSCLLPYDLHSGGDRNPSAALNIELLLYNCFVCGGGSLLWATQEILGISAADARRLIEQNLQPSNQSKQQVLAEIESLWSRSDGPGRMPTYSHKIIEKWACYSRYLDGRGISRDVQKAMMTGVNLKNQDEVATDVFILQPRIVIPHTFRQKVVGWSMRKISDAQIGPKYKHTREFPKQETLYNYDSTDHQNSVIVVESPLSVLRLMSLGFGNAVATFGAEVNQEQIALLAGYPQVLLFPDGDRAGYATLERYDRQGNDVGILRVLLGLTDTRVVDHGVSLGTGRVRTFSGKDAADYTADELKDLISNAVPGAVWRWPDGIDKVEQRRKRGVQKAQHD